VLLYHWDVDHKRLQLPMDAIRRREKQEMLRAIAYEIQAGDEGLKGNLISAERFTRLLTDIDVENDESGGQKLADAIANTRTKIAHLVGR